MIETTKLYEALILVEAGRAARDWEATRDEILEILPKHGATVRQATRYDERKLAYPVKGAKRGVYLLVYFDSDPEAIREIRGDLVLSEAVLRSQIIRMETNEVPEAITLGNASPRDVNAVDAEPPAAARPVESAADADGDGDGDEEDEDETDGEEN